MRALVNRVDPALFAWCFEIWIKLLWSERHDFIAINDKTSRRTRQAQGLESSAHAERLCNERPPSSGPAQRPGKDQLACPRKKGDHATPNLLDQLAEKGQLKGALVTTDAMGCQVEIAAKIVEHGTYGWISASLAVTGDLPAISCPRESVRKRNHNRNSLVKFEGFA